MVARPTLELECQPTWTRFSNVRGRTTFLFAVKVMQRSVAAVTRQSSEAQRRPLITLQVIDLACGTRQVLLKQQTRTVRSAPPPRKPRRVALSQVDLPPSPGQLRRHKRGPTAPDRPVAHHSQASSLLGVASPLGTTGPAVRARQDPVPRGRQSTLEVADKSTNFKVCQKQNVKTMSKLALGSQFASK